MSEENESNPITLAGIDHIVLPAYDLEAMLGFYRDVLGCVLEWARPEIGLYHLRVGGSLIDLMDRSGDGGEGPPGVVEHFALALSEFDGEAITKHLKTHGVAVDEIAMRFGATGKGPSLYIKDPQGNAIELKGPAEQD
ncbi:MAG: VOC family protein [Pseudomonadota bacterium]